MWEAFLGKIKNWKTVDTSGTSANANTDASGFWRLPETSQEERERAFEADKQELERLGKLKSALGMWPDEGVLHFYSPSALILGKLDRRLPKQEAALQWLENEAVPTVLRIAGGQAIVSDSEVLNLSILFSEPDERLSIDDGFRLIAGIIQEAWGRILEARLGERPAELELTIGEVADSYCPGEYDLSLRGKKVCGIAQRRVKNAIGVMAYISVGGDQDARCRLVRDFYDHGEADERFPASDPTVMTTLNDAFDVSVAELKHAIQAVIGSND